MGSSVFRDFASKATFAKKKKKVMIEGRELSSSVTEKNTYISLAILS